VGAMPLRGPGTWALAALLTAISPPAWLAPAAGQDKAPADLTAEQIVEKNVAARGGLDAWRKIQTMAWSGHIRTGNDSGPSVEFVFEQKRPNKTRFEITSGNEKTLQVFDGTRGWRIGAALGGAPVLRRFTPLEVRFARAAQGIDGLLIDHQARGIAVTLEGTEEIEGRSTYRLNVTLPSGSTRRVWINRQTFLEVKHERQTRTRTRADGTSSVFYRNYRAIDGLKMPLTIESAAHDGKPAEKMEIDNVTLNPSLSDAHFERPDLPQRRKEPPELQSALPPP